MRVAWWVEMLCASSAFARSWSGQVINQGQPAAGALVKIFAKAEQPLVGCPAAASSRNYLLGKCLCPAERESFTHVALEGLPPVAPLVTVIAGADGRFVTPDLPKGKFLAQAT